MATTYINIYIVYSITQSSTIGKLTSLFTILEEARLEMRLHITSIIYYNPKHHLCILTSTWIGYLHTARKTESPTACIIWNTCKKIIES